MVGRLLVDPGVDLADLSTGVVLHHPEPGPVLRPPTQWTRPASLAGSSGSRRSGRGRDIGAYAGAVRQWSRVSSVSRSQSVTIGASRASAQAASWSWWCGSRGSPDGAERHHPAAVVAVGEVPDVAGDRAAPAVVGEAGLRAGAAHAVDVAGDRHLGHGGAARSGASTSNAWIGRQHMGLAPGLGVPGGVVEGGRGQPRSGRSRTAPRRRAGPRRRTPIRAVGSSQGASTGSSVTGSPSGPNTGSTAEPADEGRAPRGERRRARRSSASIRPSQRRMRVAHRAARQAGLGPVEQRDAPGRGRAAACRRGRTAKSAGGQVGATVHQVVEAAGAVRRRERGADRGRSPVPRRSFAVTTCPSGGDVGRAAAGRASRSRPCAGSVGVDDAPPVARRRGPGPGRRRGSARRRAGRRPPRC